jgi:chromosome segregation ATPase
MEQQFLKARHDNALLEQRLAVVRTERGHWNAQADQAQKRLNAVLELVRKRQEHKEDVESARAERQKLFAEKSQLEASLSAVQAEADRENRRLAAQEKAGEALRARIHETNTLVAKHYTDELKEELAEMIRQVQETKVLAAELEANNPELTKAEADLVSTRELLAQFKDVTQAALKELKSLKDHMEQRKQEFGRLRESTALLKEIRSKNTELQREIAALQEVEDVAVRQKKERKELEYTLRLYRAGVALLEETATKEKQIASSTNRPVDRALVTVGDTQSKMPIILEDSFQE